MVTVNKELIESLLDATKNGTITWNNSEKQSCCEGEFNKTLFMICKYEVGTSTYEVSFNQFDSDGYIIEPFREYNDSHNLFPLLLELAETVWEKKLVVAA